MRVISHIEQWTPAELATTTPDELLARDLAPEPAQAEPSPTFDSLFLASCGVRYNGEARG